MSRAFFDSNVLLYGIKGDDAKAVAARRLMQRGMVISVQCLNEVASVARRKLNMPWKALHEALEIIEASTTEIVPIDLNLHHAGLKIVERYQLSIYDGMIVAAALIAECDTLYSEDMHDGLVIDGRLRIVNPFAPDGLTV